LWVSLIRPGLPPAASAAPARKSNQREAHRPANRKAYDVNPLPSLPRNQTNSERDKSQSTLATWRALSFAESDGAAVLSRNWRVVPAVQGVAMTRLRGAQASNSRGPEATEHRSRCSSLSSRYLNSPRRQQNSLFANLPLSGVTARSVGSKRRTVCCCRCSWTDPGAYIPNPNRRSCRMRSRAPR
jgi:hypothetical protein